MREVIRIFTIFLVCMILNCCASIPTQNAPVDIVFVGKLINLHAFPNNPYQSWKPYSKRSSTQESIKISTLGGAERATFHVTVDLLGAMVGSTMRVITALNEYGRSAFTSSQKEYLIEATLFGHEYWQDDKIYPVYRDTNGGAVIFPLNSPLPTPDNKSWMGICGIDLWTMLRPVQANIPVTGISDTPREHIDYLLQKHLIRIKNGNFYYDEGVFVDSLAEAVQLRNGKEGFQCENVSHWL
ncbi:MAG: hypothetical protein WBR15_09355 [Gammaproteobacteria bacterium]